MKRIIFILQTPPPFHGSTVVGKQIVDIVNRESQFEVSIINSNLSKNVSDIGKNNIEKYFKYLNSLFALIYNIIRYRPSLVYIAVTVKGIGFLKDFIYILISKLFSIKIVFHFHNKGIANSKSNLFLALYKFAFKNEYAIILSERLKFDINKYFISNNIFICPNSIPDSEFLIYKNDLDKSINILYISNLLISKGILDLIESCFILKKNNIKFTCDIIGAEKDITSIELNDLIKKKHLSDCITYHGPKYGTEKELFLQTANILIYPTYSDCLPLVLIEALKFSLPIIATDEGAISDIVISNYNGFIIEKNDPIGIFEKLQYLKNHHDLYLKMRSNSRKLYESKFTHKHYEHNILNILHKLTNG